MSKKMYTVEEIANLTHSAISGSKNRSISGVASLKEATPDHLSFFSNSAYSNDLAASRAGIIFVPAIPKNPSTTTTYLICHNPSLAFQQFVEMFSTADSSSPHYIDPSSSIHPSSMISPEVTIMANVTIGKDVTIGDNSVVFPGAVLLDNVTVGKNSTIHPNVVIYQNSIIGNNVTIQSNTTIGSSGFGYSTDENGIHRAIAQVGKIIIEDNVEIGSNCVLDRARFDATVIGKGTKIDNLVQIAHNVTIGCNNLIVSQTGIAGSTSTGNNVVFGGQCGVVGHIHIDSNVQLASRSGVSKNLKSGTYRGAPALPMQEYNRIKVHQKKLPNYAKRIKQLEEKVDEILKTMF